MGRDYYGTLGISRTASAEDVRAGYKWAAAKWHPQKHVNNKEEARQRFHEIAEAYDVLIDPLRRRRYDDVGERALKNPPVGSNFEPYQYVGDPFQLFTTFFASANPLAAAYDPHLSDLPPIVSADEKDESIEVEVNCTLAELQEGTTRRLVVGRTRLGPGFVPFKEDKLVTLPIQAGWKPGMRVIFKTEGHHTSADKAPGDLIVLLSQNANQS